MKRLIPIFIVVAALLASCGGEVNMEDCKQYCSTMNNLKSTGTWHCPGKNIYSSLGLCAERIVLASDDTDSGIYIQTCYREKTANLGIEPDRDDAGNYRVNESTGEYVIPGWSWFTITNPLTLDICLDQCEVNTMGDPMTDELQISIAEAGSNLQFLKAQLTQQCRSEAAER